MFVTRQVDEKTDIVVVDNTTVNHNANDVANVNTEGNTNTATDSKETLKWNVIVDDDPAIDQW